MNTDRDKKIDAGLETITKETEIYEDLYYEWASKKMQTNCHLKFPDMSGTVNILTLSEDSLLYFYEKARPGLKISGFTIEDWKTDIGILVNRLVYKSFLDKLYEIKAALEAQYTENKKADIAVDNLLKELDKIPTA